MVDQFTETTRTGWFARLRSSIGGVVVGFVLVAVGSGLLFWNEGRSVKRYRALTEGAGRVIEVQGTTPNATQDGELVHVAGEATTDEVLRDEEFGMQAQALGLERNVEMYQWVEHEKSETRKKLGGGEEKVTTYSYEREWRSGRVDSSGFRESAGHENPQLPVTSRSVRAQRVDLGGYQLRSELAAQITASTILPAGETEAQAAQALLQRPVTALQGTLYVGREPQGPQVGDLRISFRMVPPATVSVVGQQFGSELGTYEAKSGRVALLEMGTVPAAAMFEMAQSRNRMLAWLLRLGGFLATLFGFSAILAPVKVLADVVPLFGRLVGAGIGFVAFILAAVLSLVVIAVGWIFYRPLLGIGLLAVALAAIVMLVRRARRVTPAAAAQPELPPLPT